MKSCFFLVFLSFLIGHNITAQSLTDIVPFDPETRVGKLSNGLSYYIRKNTKPEKRAEMRLIVNAGSVQERDDQRGVAHFLEHMAFNGTKNFPKNELLSYLQKAGVRFGADLNASTGFDYTVYMLPIPTDDPQILQSGYQVLRDWAGSMLLEAEEIDKERGIILEERRMRRDANQRTFEQYLPTLTNNSKYSNRVPIGDEQIIKTAPQSVFQDFYRDWYRPNNMAVVIVGDINIEEAEKKIQSMFGDLRNPENAPIKSAVVPISWHNNTKAKITGDAETINNQLYIYFNLAQREKQPTWNDFATSINNALINNMISSRFQEQLINPTAPASFARIGFGDAFLQGYTISAYFALVKSDPAAAIKFIVGEMLRAKKYGFLVNELDRAKKNYFKIYEEGLKEKGKIESARYVGEYLQHFINNEPAPGIEAEASFVKNYLSKLTVEDLNKKMQSIDIQQPAVIVLNATEAMKSKTSEEALVQAYEVAKQQTVTAYTEKVGATKLMDRPSMKGKIIKEEQNDQLGTKTLVLSNGIKVLYKKTEYKNDEVVFRGVKWGGLTQLSDKEVRMANYLSLVSSLGLGSNKAADIPKILTGVQANFYYNLAPTQLIMGGNSTTKDIEQFFQILHLRLTNINYDSLEFEGLKNNFNTQIAGLFKNPVFKFNDTLSQFRYKYSPRSIGFPRSAELASLRLNDLKKLNQKITGDLNGALLTFTGNINEGEFKELLLAYVATIPTKQKPSTVDASKVIRSITGNNDFSIKAGKENKSVINYATYGILKQVKEEDVLAFTLFGDILQMKTTEKLREEMGSTYSPSVSSSVTKASINEFYLNLNVSGLPDNVGKIIDAYDALITKISSGDFTDEDLQKAKAQRIKSYENLSKNNGYWAYLIEQQTLYGYSESFITMYKTNIESVSKTRLVEVAKEYLKVANRLKAVMNPE